MANTLTTAQEHVGIDAEGIHGKVCMYAHKFTV